MHPDLYRHTPRKQWQSAAEQLKRGLPSLEPHVALLEFRRLVALSGDGHTCFRNPDEAWGQRRYLPLYLQTFELPAIRWQRASQNEYDDRWMR